ERYQEVEVSKIAEALTQFFRKLRRQSNQTVREFNSAFDRAYARLLEIDCKLPEVAKAWVYLSALNLSNSEELSLLASVNNEYVTSKLQKAATLHEKSLQVPWRRWNPNGPPQGGGDRGRPTRGAYLTEVPEAGDEDYPDGDSAIPEEEAAELHEAFMAQEAAKSRYREISRARGFGQGGDGREDGKSASERLQLAKARSYCAGCKRRGHWHRDPECPLNGGKAPPSGDAGAGKKADTTKDAYVVHVAYEVGDWGEGLYAITDSACSRTVAGEGWLQQYLEATRKYGTREQLLPCSEDFRFGASKLFHANYTATIYVEINGKGFWVRAAIVAGDVPLLLSRSLLATLGMVFDLERHRASFKNLGVDDIKLHCTVTGHPAVAVNPKGAANLSCPTPQQWGSQEVIMIEPTRQQYTVFMACASDSCQDAPLGHDHGRQQASNLPVLFPKKINDVIHNILTADVLSVSSFCTWWKQTRQSNDFWIETPKAFYRIHIVPRRAFFYPDKWSLLMTCGNTEHLFLTMFFGSEEVCLPDDLPTCLVRLMASASKSIWDMNKAELIAAASEVGLVYHSSWTTGELRSLLQEHRQAHKEENPVKGLSSLNVVALREKAGNLGIILPPRATKGMILRMIRDQQNPPGKQVVSFGRYKNYLFDEVPRGYLEWSIRETKNNENASEDLRHLANFAKNKLFPEEEQEAPDPEVNATIPYYEDEERSSTSSRTTWSMVKESARGYSSQTPVTPPAAKAKAKIAPKNLVRKIPEEESRPVQHQGGQQLSDPGAITYANEAPDDKEAFYDCFEESCENDPWPEAQVLEGLAKEARKNKDYHEETIVKVIKGLARFGEGDRHRQAVPTGGHIVVLGAYSYGAFHGVNQRTMKFPQCALYLNAWAKAKGFRGPWTSISVAVNVGHLLHRDPNNLPGSANQTIAVGNFSGGRLWLEKSNEDWAADHYEDHDGEDHEIFTKEGKKMDGAYVSTKGHVRAFNPKRRHFVEDWRGERRISCEALVSLDTEIHYESWPAQPPVPRQVRYWPRPSRRVPATAPRSAYVKSIYAAELDVNIAEPIDPGFLFAKGGLERALEHVENCSPRVVWYHFDRNQKDLDYLEKIGEVQLREGRKLVIETNLSPGTAGYDHITNLFQKFFVKAIPSGYKYEVHVTNFVNAPDAHEAWAVDGGPQQLPTDEPSGASAITFTGSVSAPIRGALTRLHQNLGHPSVSDLTRHLRFAGADDKVIAACKGMRCQTCDRTKKVAAPRPASLPSFLDFNALVSVDVFHVFDAHRKRHELLSIIDHATTYHLVAVLPGHSNEAFEKGFVELWGRTFGAPRVIAADLESGLQKGLGRYTDFTGTKLRSKAGQAHWQQGVIERHGGWYKEILNRVIDEHTVYGEDIHLAVAAVNAAKNELRRKHGFSPAQAVFGKDPACPEELLSGRDEERYLELMTEDRKRQKEIAIRNAAKAAFFRTQVDNKFRRSLLQRARVKHGAYAVGQMVCFFRIEKVATKRGQWRGPGLILGSESGNWWISHGGRCYLTAEEHMRPATAEEIGDLMNSRVARADLEKLLAGDQDDPNNYNPEEDGDGGDNVDINVDAEDMDMDLQPEEPEQDDRAVPPQDPPSYGPVRQRARTKKPQPHSVNILKKCLTERSREKQYEKEIPWAMVPPEQHAAFKQAERKQLQEHYDLNAFTPLTKEQSDQVYAETPRDRILSSRWAYRDKNWSRRRQDASVEWRPKARLVVGGHLDPDIGEVKTDAPTISRLGLLTILQIVASHQRDEKPWTASAGDVSAAFLNGQPIKRLLYMKQSEAAQDRIPRHGAR
ncbi:GIP, partial [Symbiodinium necroappetens]